LRDYVYVGDVARANVLALEDERADYRSFNVAGQKATSVLDCAHIIGTLCDKDLEPEICGDYRFGDTRHTFSSSDALAQLGWEAEVPLEDFLREYVEWVRQQDDREDFYSRSERLMRSAGVIRRVRS
jgi:dTDP-L-rhamnose 4-epimerase